MSNRAIIRYNTGAPDASIFTQGLSRSFYRPKEWSVTTDHVRDTVQFEYRTGISLGLPLYYETVQNGVLLEDVKLDLTISAIVGAGVGTFARGADYLGLALIPSIEVTYQQNTLQRYDSQALFIQNIRDHDITHRDVFNALLEGNLTPAERNTLATGEQTTTTYLKPYWYMMYSHLPILSALANKIRFKVNIANPQDFVETDYTLGATVSLVKAKFRANIINTTGVEREEFARLTFAPKGLTYLFQHISTIPYQKINAGSTEAIIDLKGLTLPFFSIYFLFQSASYILNPYQKRPFELSPADFRRMTQYGFRDGQGSNFVTINGEKDAADYWQKFHCQAKWQLPIGFYSATEITELKNVALGSHNASNIPNLQWFATFGAALPEDYYVSFIVLQHNWVSHASGELQTIFQA